MSHAEKDVVTLSDCTVPYSWSGLLLLITGSKIPLDYIFLSSFVLTFRLQSHQDREIKLKIETQNVLNVGILQLCFSAVCLLLFKYEFLHP